MGRGLGASIGGRWMVGLGDLRDLPQLSWFYGHLPTENMSLRSWKSNPSLISNQNKECSSPQSLKLIHLQATAHACCFPSRFCLSCIFKRTGMFYEEKYTIFQFRIAFWTKAEGRWIQKLITRPCAASVLYPTAHSRSSQFYRLRMEGAGAARKAELSALLPPAPSLNASSKLLQWAEISVLSLPIATAWKESTVQLQSSQRCAPLIPN